jgi:hypothetical protein
MAPEPEIRENAKRNTDNHSFSFGSIFGLVNPSVNQTSGIGDACGLHQFLEHVLARRDERKLKNSEFQIDISVSRLV